MRRVYEKFDNQLRESRFLARDKFSMADITTLCAVDFAKVAGMDIPPHCTGMSRCYGEVSARPGAAASL